MPCGKVAKTGALHITLGVGCGLPLYVQIESNVPALLTIVLTVLGLSLLMHACFIPDTG